MLLDYEKLADLADVFEPPEFPRMLLMAELNVISLLDKIRLCVESAEMNDAGRHVHTLGGLLGMYGMKSAARYVCQIELDPASLSPKRGCWNSSWLSINLWKPIEPIVAAPDKLYPHWLSIQFEDYGL